MRRALTLSLLVALTAAGLGCKNIITGRCDCTYNPDDAHIGAPTNPYPKVGEPMPGAGGSAEKTPMALPPGK